ncbi:MAG: hypothetical protein Q9224_004547, partial [Gallowayella concinna]
ILRGNLAPGGAVAKITGKEGTKFVGKARVFEKENQLDAALSSGQIKRGENQVLIVRYEGPKGGPGMPEQLKASAALMGAKLTNVALILVVQEFVNGAFSISFSYGAPGDMLLEFSMKLLDEDLLTLGFYISTDGRYSGASHGFIVGHVVPEAAVGGPIAVVRDGDVITIDAETNRLDMDVSEEELQRRMMAWKAPRKVVTRGVLAKYAALVGDASHGALTDAF